MALAPFLFALALWCLLVGVIAVTFLAGYLIAWALHAIACATVRYSERN